MRLLPNVLKPSQYKQKRNYIAPDTSVVEQTNMLTVAEQMGKELINSAEKKAEQIVKAAEAEAEEIRLKSKEDFDRAYDIGLEAGKKEGFDAGYNDGIEEGRKISEEKVDELSENLLTVIRKIEDAKEKVIEQQQNDLPELATEIASVIISTLVEQNKELVTDLIENSLKDCYNESYLYIYVSKSVYELITSKDSGFLERIKPASSDIRIMQRNELDDTDCIIETSEYVSDISMKSQLNKIKSVLRK